jgi:hypothetical protein
MKVLINIIVVFILYHMSLDSIFHNMCTTCVYIYILK